MMIGSLLFAVCFIGIIVADIPAHRIDNFPGYGRPKTDTYGGTIEISPGSGVYYYYIFVKSSSSSNNIPLSLWLNGGPGCSSLLGFFQENGPYNIPTVDGKLTERAQSWHQSSHMLWLEAPAGVGMSFSEHHVLNSTYVTDDHETAKRNALFLQAWFGHYPEYRSNDFYITGESYAGTYIPTLMKRLQLNKPVGVPRVRGLMIGNPCTDPVDDHNAFFTLAKTHALIPPSLATEIETQCPATGKYILDDSCCQFNQTMPPQSSFCISLLKEMYRLFANNNLYDIYSTCDGAVNSNEPCSTTGPLPQYLDSNSVRQAIHAPPLSITGNWAPCSNQIDYTSNYNSISKQVYPVIRSNDPELRIVIYSGDVDGCVPWFGTKKWTGDLNGNPKDPSKPWNFWEVDGQLTGYSIAYDKFNSYVTIKGSGHEVPMYKPDAALTLFQRFLNKTW